MAIHNIALVTIVLGQRYAAMYDVLFRRSHQAYADKQGYQFKVCSEFLDPNATQYELASFQKALIGVQEWAKTFDRIVFVDADVLINPSSPPIHEHHKNHALIGVVDEYSQPSPEERLQIQSRMGWEKSASDYYKLAGYDLTTPTVLNTGVMILSPQRHGKFLADVYEKNRSTALTHSRGFHFEQSSIGYALQKMIMFEKLDNKFNAIYPLHLISQNRNKPLRDYFNENYFTHFAGNTFLNAAEQIRQLNGG